MKNNHIAIIMNDNPNLLTGILAILKSGNCFIPINPAFPHGRIRFIIADCNIKILLTDKANYEKARQIAAEVPSVKHLLCIDDILEKTVPAKDKKQQPGPGHDNPAYVIYTSGSTGQPKGVPITHKNLIPLFCWFGDYFQLGKHTRVMQNLSHTFDFGIFEILTTVLFGGRLYILNKDGRGDFSFYDDYLKQRQINTLHTTPVFFSNLADVIGKMPFITLLHLGGERLSGNLVNKALDVIAAGGRIYNGYGPTEASINCAIFSITGKNLATDQNNIPIGRPSALHKIYILNGALQLQPVGPAGELCIAGAGLSQGYMNRPELTQQKFILKKLPGSARERIYRTGDLSRWLTDGNIEFLGRIDHQIKIRGFRIELEEIERNLALYPAIKETVVVVQEHQSSGNYLCAYIVTQTPEQLTVSQLREFLLKRLPDYMVPAYFIQLEKIPLTPNGKIDRKALPEPEDTLMVAGVEYVPPVSDTEKKLVSIWQSLLTIKRIGIMDDFFQVGGDSILVNRCIAGIREELHAEISLRKFFERPFIKALAQEIEKQERRVASIIKPAERVGEIPLSFAQERLWFLQELDTGNKAYFVPRVIRMKGKLDVSLIEKTFTEIIRRHEILRTVFPNIDGRPVQQIKPPYEFKIPVLDWSGMEIKHQEKQVSDFLNKEGQRPFDFKTGPMLRVTLLKLAEEEHLFVLTEHHLIHDGWTQGVLLNEIITIFTAYSLGEPHSLPELPIQYADYAIWQREFLKGDVLAHHLNYWQEKLAGMPPVLEFPGDRPRPAVISGRGDLEIFRLSCTMTHSLKEFSRQKGVTLFMTMLAVFKTLFYRYTGVEDLCIGIPIANRRYKEMEGMLGMVINTLPLRTQVQGGLSFSQYLQHVKQTCLELYQHEDTPFGNIVEVLQPERSLSYSPLFQSLFAFMDTPGGELQLPGLELELLPSHNRSAKFDFNVVVVPPPEQESAESSETGEILVEWEYNTDIFDAPTMKRMISHYLELLSASTLQPEMKIAALSLMSDEEIKQLLFEFNNTETVYPRDKTIHQLFAEQASKTPDHVALVGADEGEEKKRRKEEKKSGGVETVQITYRQLNGRSDCLAAVLVEKGLLPGAIAAIMAEPSINLIIGIWGILKAGAAYLPMDPGYPQDRIQYMVKDSGAKILIIKSEIRIANFETNPNNQNKNDQNINQNLGIPFVLDFENLNFEFVSNFDIRISNFHSSNLAYLIYTSGTTGKPKGAMIEHRNLVNYVNWFRNRVCLGVDDGTILTSSFAFDLGYTTVFPSLVGGSRLHMVSRETYLSAEHLLHYIGIQQITYLKLTPSLFSAIVESPGFNVENIKKLKLIVLGGEAIKVNDVAKAWIVKPTLLVINHYGPTETTIGCIAQFIDFDQFEKFKKVPTIGNPIANMKVVILDKDRNMVPIGVPGELHVFGAGVGRGYLNNPVLTAEKFGPQITLITPIKKTVKNKSFAGVKGELFQKLPLGLYKTGDLAQWLPGGTVKFLGRIDQQVKIRGFRIELEEIEVRLLSHKNIKEVVVIDREYYGGDKYLCAYIVWQEKESKSEPAELRKFILEKLPEFMVPAYFVEIERIPLTANGKLNKKLLPEPGVKTIDSGSRPVNYIQEKSVEIWNDILGRKNQPVGIDDNFFQVGGHSLKAIILISRMHKAFYLHIPLGEVFKRPTIRELAAYVMENVKQTYEVIAPVEKKEYYELSSAQKRLYFLQQMDETGTVYNLPFAAILEGVVDKDKLESVFLSLVKRHESLRTSFVMIGDSPVQRIHNEVKFEIAYHYSSLITIPHFIQAFDLAKAPLLRVSLAKFAEQKHLLLVDMHHIISDGISRRILAEEFMHLYSGKELPALKLQYKDFATWQGSRETAGVYWQEQFGDEIPVLDLPIDYPRPIVQGFAGDRLTFGMEKEMTPALKNLALAEGVTLYMVLLSLYYILLAKLSNQEDIVVGTPTAGRRHVDLEHIIGMFVNTLALRNYPTGAKTFTAFLSEIKESSLQAFENQDYQYEKLVEALPVTRDAGRNPLFDTMFALQNFDRQEIDIPGLKLSPHQYENKTAKFDLTLTAVESVETIQFTFEYAAALFKRETIERFAGYFLNILAEIVTDKNRFISEFEIIPETEKQRLLFDLNKKGEYPVEHTIHGLFAGQVLKSPDRIAVVGTREEEKQLIHLSYGELNEESHKLAGALIEKGVRPGTIVALKFKRSIDMIIGILGILTSGSAYLPIDPELPLDRIAYMLKDSNAKILINKSPSEIRNPKPETNPNVQNSNDQNKNFEIPFVSNFVLRASDLIPSNLAYIIYTSGSTGKPKGVPITHANISPLLHWGYRHLEIGGSERVIQNLSYYFDWSVWEIFITLTGGAVLYMETDDSHQDPAQKIDFINKNKITTLHITPTQCSYLVNLGCRMETLKYLFIGAEKLSLDLLKRSFAVIGNRCRVFNMYGPTEASIIAAVLEIQRGEENQFASLSSVPIGKSIANGRLIILNKSLNFCPLNMAGELYIAGDGTAGGYLNNPGLSAERFINFHHSAFDIPRIQHSILYCTGDICKWLADGNIEFLGRRDHQVKIRGFRIELGEIEKRLMNIQGIKEAVVLVQAENICAYIVSQKEYEELALRESLARELPGYMIPTFFIFLDKIPLTPNGKVNRGYLPMPGFATGKTTQYTYTVPVDPVEKKLAVLWEDILGIGRQERGAISSADNFFHLGGHSLNATIMASRVHKEFSVKIPLAEIFKAPTLRELAQYIKSRAIERHLSITPVETKEYYGLSSAQKRLYVLQQMDKESTAYNISSIMILTGHIDQEKLTRAIARLIQRHESLRTSFDIIDDEPVQRVHETVAFAIECKNVSPGKFSRAFDLSAAPLLRVGLQTITGQKHLFMVDMHHIIADGMSLEVLIRDFAALYNDEELPSIKITYKDYAQWQSHEKASEHILKQAAYWQNEFAGEIPLLELPADFARPPVQDFTGDSIKFQLDRETTAALNALSLQSGTTLYMTLLSIYTILLAKLSSREEIVIGSPIAGRRHVDLENIIGMFVNTLAIRNDPVGEKKFSDFLQEVKQKTLKAFDNQDYQYEELVEKVVVNRDFSRNPLFDAEFLLQNIDIPELHITGLQFTPYPHEHITAKFDLALAGMEKEKILEFHCKYAAKLFKRETVARFISYFKNIIKGVIENKHTKIRALALIPEAEQKRLLYEWNTTDAEYPEAKTIAEIFTEQVEKTPDYIAVVGAGAVETLRATSLQITYFDLNQRANHLAGLLIEKGVLADQVIGIMTARTIEMIIGIMGILKSGGAYLPIAPDYPQERINYMLKDSNATILITLHEKKEIINCQLSIVNYQLLTGAPQLPSHHSAFDIPPIPHSHHLAYIIYTSGTTGNPKGVAVEHKSVINLVMGLKQRVYHFGQGVKDRQAGQAGQTLPVALVSPFIFDASIKQIFPALLSGHTLVIIPETVRLHSEKLLQLFKKKDIRISDGTPAHLKMLMNHKEQLAKEFYLEKFLIGGEALETKLCRDFTGAVNRENFQVVNVYGPTECCDVTSLYNTGSTNEDNNPYVSLGRPIAHMTIAVVGPYRQLQPVGLSGELYISGIGVSRGYLNRPELTAEKFTRFAISYNTDIFYKTGDLVRRDTAGNIEFVGRIDQQVKIRGYRIELGEIESRLMKHPGIKEAVVIDREYPGGEKYLCAYIICQKGIAPCTHPELREYLSEKLPDYMLPSNFVSIEHIPLTPNGKLDRKQLPEPGIKPAGQYHSPQDPIEEKLLEIWAEVLGLPKEQIGTEDSFFELGGHSLKAVIVLAKIQKDFAVQVTLAEMFKLSTIKAMAQWLKNFGETQLSNIEAVEQKEYYELSYNQKRLWLLNQLQPESASFNIPGRLAFAHNVDENMIKEALYRVIQRHESLRTGFKIVTGEPFQYIVTVNEIAIPFRTIDIANLEDNRKQTEREQIYEHEQKTPFDLNELPLFRSILVKLAEDRYDFIFNVHHIITDGWSMEILKKEFFLYYEGFRSGREYRPGNLTVQYKDFAAWHNQKTAEPLMSEPSYRYWQKRLAQEIPPLDLPVKPGGNRDDRTGGEYRCFIANEIKNKLKKLAQDNRVTLFAVLFTIYLILLSRLARQKNISCSIISAGRDHLLLQDVMGFFVNSILFNIDIKEDECFIDFLQRVSADVFAVFQHQWYPIELVFKELKMKYPEVSASFNMLNMWDETLDSEIREFKTGTGKNTQDVKFIIEVYATEYKNGIWLNWAYKKSLFNPGDIEYIVDEYLKLCAYFPDNITENIKDKEKKRGFKKNIKKDKDLENGD